MVSSTIVYLRIPAKICCVDEQNTSSRHGSRCGCSQMADLKQQSHRWRQRDTLITGQGEHLVVVHDGIQGLDPHGINVSVKYNPFWTVSRQVGQVSHDDREQTCVKMVLVSS